MRNCFDYLQKEDLTPDLRLLADVCGIEAMRRIVKHLQGLSFYIPKISRMELFIKRYLEINPDKPRKEIAKELNVSLNFLNKFEKNM